MSIARILARHASPRYGLVTRPQLLAAKVCARTIDRAVDDGLMARLHEGVYVLPGSPLTWRRTVLAACLSAGPKAVASHATAAHLLSLSDVRPKEIEVTVPIRSHPIGDGFVVHRTRRPLVVVEHDGIPVTCAARTIADMAARVPRSRLGEMLETAIRTGRATRADLERELRRVFRGRSVLAELVAELVVSDSVLETRFRQALRQRGLPEPVPQYEIRRGGILVARVDLAYPEQRIVVELDGLAFHSDRTAVERDRRRRNDIRTAGYALLEFGWSDVVRPNDAMRRVRRTLWERGHPDVVSL